MATFRLFWGSARSQRGGSVRYSHKPAQNLRREGIRVAVIAVPAPVAQNVLNLVVASGIKAILNFSSGPLDVPLRSEAQERRSDCLGDTWLWNQAAAAVYQETVEPGSTVSQVMQAFSDVSWRERYMLAYLSLIADGVTSQVILSVKAGKLHAPYVRDLRGVMEREKACNRRAAHAGGADKGHADGSGLSRLLRVTNGASIQSSRS